MLLGDVVEFNARKHPDRNAFIFEGNAVTWSRLRERVNRLSSAVLKVASPGERVAILSQNCPEYLECYYGVPMAGTALVLLNFRLHINEIVRMINDAGASVLIVESGFLEIVELVRDQLSSVRLVISIGGGDGAVDYEDWLRESPPDRPDVNIEESDLAWLLYTSGTTGKPKGVMISHKNILTSAINSLIDWKLVPEDVFLVTFPLCHAGGAGIVAINLRGSSMIVMPYFDPDIYLENIGKYKVTCTALAPIMISFLLQHLEVVDYDTGSLRSISYGSMPMHAEVLKKAIARFGNVLNQGFAMSEVIGIVTFLSMEDHHRAYTGSSYLLEATGKPMALCDVRVVNDAMEDTPPGEVGEIVIRGDQVFMGYWSNPEATQNAFAGGWFHTGDLGKVDEEGYIYVVDRKKDMIITGGLNVYPIEVEQVIYKHPAVFEAAVFGVPDENWGENVLAAVVLNPGAEVSEEEIIEFCRTELAGYKRPKKVFFIDELPKSSNMKVMKKELREQYK